MKKQLEVGLEEDGSISVSSAFVENLPEDVAKAAELVLETLRGMDVKLRKKVAPYNGSNPDIVQKLVTWRRNKAKELDVAPFIILHQRVLYAIADAVPLSEEELVRIPGFGPRSYAKYGEEILQITCA